MAKKEKNSISDTMRDIAGEVFKEYPDEFQWIIDNGFGIEYFMSDKMKKENYRVVKGECRLANPREKALEEELGRKCDFIITFYKPCISGFSDRQMHILMYHELMHIGLNKDGNPCILPHDYFYEDFQSVIDRFGADWSRTEDGGNGHDDEDD